MPMRDGTIFHRGVCAARYEPAPFDHDDANAIQRRPVRTECVSRQGGSGSALPTRASIFVYQDVRGRFMSDGEFKHMTPWKGMAGAAKTDESTDAYDTIDWLVTHVLHNNGRVGIWGISYGAFSPRRRW